MKESEDATIFIVEVRDGVEEIVKEIEDATILIEEVRDGVAEIVKDSADISHSLEILEVRVNFLFFV